MQSAAQARWFGKAGDGQWTSPLNWAGNVLPSPTDDVYLDNSAEDGSYSVYLPAGVSNVSVRSIIISPSAGNKIQLILPATSTGVPALTVTGPGYGITIENNGSLINSSGISSGAAIEVKDSFRINNGGVYTHNSRSAHADMVTALSKLPGTEKGIFSFDVPGGGYTFASTGRTYGTLILNADASGGSQAYASSAASPLIVNGDFIIKTGVTVNLDLTAATIIYGNYVQEGGVFNLASQPNANTVYIKGDFNQAAGVITETSSGLPAIELNGTQNQSIQATGSITNSVDFRVNNHAGVSLLSRLSLPYRLNLIDGIVNSHSFLITLQAGCSIKADSLANNSFINGPLRKEGLLAATHFLFPVGKDITQRWIALKEVTGNYTAEFFKTDPHTLAMPVGAGIHHTSSIEYWSVQADAIPAPTTRTELSFDNVNSGGVTDMTTLRVAQLAAGIWTDMGNTTTTGTAGSAGSVVSNPLIVFDAGNNYFALASSDAFQNPLPLKLVLFDGHAFGDNVVINWSVSASWQPAYFELQSSADGQHFIFLSKMGALVNQQNYQYTDKRKLSGKQYYRLRAIEKDGSVIYTKDIPVDVNTNSTGGIQLWPSVVKTNASLFVHAVVSGKALINIYTANGRVMQTTHVFMQTGNNSIPLQLDALRAGVYIIAVKTGDDKISHARFVKLE